MEKIKFYKKNFQISSKIFEQAKELSILLKKLCLKKHFKLGVNLLRDEKNLKKLFRFSEF